MALEKEKDYTYRGWKLGEKVKYKEDDAHYEIIGFDEKENEEKFIAINHKNHNLNIEYSKHVTSYIKTNLNCFDWVKENEIEKIEQFEDVLILEYQEVFDNVAVRIVYQNKDILKRDDFLDEDIGVNSGYCFYFSYDFNAPHGYWLSIQGSGKKLDDKVILVTKKEAEIIKQKVKDINKKYGIKKYWRAKKGESYWIVKDNYLPYQMTEDFLDFNQEHYLCGNYFKTREQAEEVAIKIKEFLKKYHDNIKNKNER